jgi:hypothetical protein
MGNGMDSMDMDMGIGTGMAYGYFLLLSPLFNYD